MPLALGIIAILAIIVAVRGNYVQAGQLVNATFFSTNGGFLKWFGSIVAIGLIFRIIGAPKAGQLFIALLILVYFMENQGVISAIEQAITSGPADASAASAPVTSSATTPAPSSSSSTTTAITPNAGGF